MGVSFKISKTGSRFRPKVVLSDTPIDDGEEEISKENSRISGRNESVLNSTKRKLEADIIEGDEDGAGIFGSSISSGGLLLPSDNEVSFTLNLYPDGYFIGKPSENDTTHQAMLHDVPKLLHPYDRASETLFSAIESGRLPGDILDDLPCKYVNGTLLCEVRDYRKSASEPGFNVPCADGLPIVNKVHLRMSLENVVKDIPLISDISWTYGDLMEVESRILKALQPQLCLDPSPKLDRLCEKPVPAKLNLSLCSARRKRLRQMPEANIASSNKIHVNKIGMDRVGESLNGRLGDSGPMSGEVMAQNVHENLAAHNIGQVNILTSRPKSLVQDASIPGLPSPSPRSKYQGSAGNPKIMQDHGSGSVVNASGASSSIQDTMISYTDNMHGKRENQDGPLSPLPNMTKRQRPTAIGPEGIQQHHLVPPVDGFQGSDIQWKNALLQHQINARGNPYANTGIQKYPQQVFDGVLNQEAGSTPFAETEKLDRPELNRVKNDMQMGEIESNHLDSQQSRLQPRLSQQNLFMRSNSFQTPWSNMTQHIEKDPRKERKLVQSPRVSAQALVQSPLSSKSGEFSSGSLGPQFGPTATTAVLGASQKDKPAVTSIPPVVGTPSLTSSANDSMQRQNQVQMVSKRRSNSLPKAPAVGSPASVSNMSVPSNANSPSVATPPSADQTMLDRFSKIEMVAMRYQLHCKKNKADEYPIRKPTFSPQKLMAGLSMASHNEDFKDDTCTMPLSKSLAGGSMNCCKLRVINFLQTERVLQGSGVSVVSRARSRMIMSEKANDGSVAIHYGDAVDGDFLSAEDYASTLPNAHFSDLLAAQFCTLMVREGYHLMEDHVQPKPTRMNLASSNQSNAPGISPNNSAAEMQQYSETASGQPHNEVAKPTNSVNTLNASQSLLANTRMLPPGNAQALQMSQGLLTGVSMPARPQQLDPQPSLQQPQQQNPQSLMQQQHPQFQRSSLMLPTNPLSHLSAIGQNSNMQLGNHMVNKPSALQLQLLQQQQQQRKMMGLGTTVNMGNMGNNIAGIQGLGNVMGMGGARGIGGTGISAPMGAISSMGNVGQNSMNLNQASSVTNTLGQQFRNPQLGTTQAAVMAANKLRAMQSRAILGGPQAGIAGMTGARQMHQGSSGLSMLGQNLHRPINPMQRPSAGPMGPPKLMTSMNLYMNPQQQQQQHQYQLQQLQQHQQQQLQQQQLQLQQQQQQLHQQHQQETTSPLQAVVSPPQVGSPSTMGIPQQLNQQPQQQQQQPQQQQASPQQMNQRTPMSPQQMNQRTPMSPQQMSSGAVHPMNAGNPEACPASPQLSSQTLGSVGSITNSPMDLQAVNKSNSVSNT